MEGAYNRPSSVNCLIFADFRWVYFGQSVDTSLYFLSVITSLFTFWLWLLSFVCTTKGVFSNHCGNGFWRLVHKSLSVDCELLIYFSFFDNNRCCQLFLVRHTSIHEKRFHYKWSCVTLKPAVLHVLIWLHVQMVCSNSSCLYTLLNTY